jgi:hypothetical protein
MAGTKVLAIYVLRSGKKNVDARDICAEDALRA